MIELIDTFKIFWNCKKAPLLMILPVLRSIMTVDKVPTISTSIFVHGRTTFTTTILTLFKKASAFLIIKTYG